MNVTEITGNVDIVNHNFPKQSARLYRCNNKIFSHFQAMVIVAGIRTAAATLSRYYDDDYYDNDYYGYGSYYSRYRRPYYRRSYSRYGYGGYDGYGHGSYYKRPYGSYYGRYNHYRSPYG